MRSILIDQELHERLKDYSKRSGIKIKKITEASIIAYLNKMKFNEGDTDGKRN